MSNPTIFPIVIILIAIALLVLVVTRPTITITRAGKILAFVSIFVFPTLAGSMGFKEHMEQSKKTEFCTSCHTMKDYGQSLSIDDPSHLPAAHFQNNRVPRDEACYTCHTNYTMFGGVKSKLRGLRHVYIQYLGTVPDKIELYTPYNSRECLHCHITARSFQEGATHNLEDGRLEQIKSGALSCLSTGCHDTTHDIKNIANKPLWMGPSPPVSNSVDLEEER